jgi:hypothetical protein
MCLLPSPLLSIHIAHYCQVKSSAGVRYGELHGESRVHNGGGKTLWGVDGRVIEIE